MFKNKLLATLALTFVCSFALAKGVACICGASGGPNDPCSCGTDTSIKSSIR